MDVLYIVVPLAIVIVVGMFWAFARSVRRGQFDDLETPAWRVLFDDEPVKRGGGAPEQEPSADAPNGGRPPRGPEPPRR